MISAASIGFLHTLLGPDHYLPSTVMSRARRWSLRGIQFVPIQEMEKYSHALAGGTICLCGLAMQFLGL